MFPKLQHHSFSGLAKAVFSRDVWIMLMSNEVFCLDGLRILETKLKRTKTKLEEPESKLRDQKRAKKISRELQEAPTKLRSDDLSTLSSDYELPRSCAGL